MSTVDTKPSTYTADNGYTVTSTPDGTVTLGKSTFTVVRIATTDPDGDTRHETHLIGARGARYLLRRYRERNGDTGIRQVISLGSGAPMRKRGNEVRVIEVGGIIEQTR